MQIADDELARVTECVWSSVLGLPLQRLPKEETPDQRIAIAARVRIAAESWSGALTLGCSELLGARIAMAAHGNNRDLTVSRIERAVGRVADRIAADVKPMLDDACVLSPPIVSEGPDVIPVGMRSIGQVCFICFSQPLLIAVAERDSCCQSIRIR
ncbi:MAG: hypothetical protein A2341_28490 [Deltaproteobacteria bacterium RIFOXYB12_FULL_58_9]|nr:MAG: hypothetical protein A2341_28490 [Deltaproteobacteria bacterium RIFOXYB12_FULL_58_9]